MCGYWRDHFFHDVHGASVRGHVQRNAVDDADADARLDRDQPHVHVALVLGGSVGGDCAGGFVLSATVADCGRPVDV